MFTVLSAPPVEEGLRDRRAERECDAGLRACAGSGRGSPWWEGRGRLVSCSFRTEHVLADLLYQLLVRQAVEAVDRQVRDEVLTGFSSDLLASSKVNQGDIGYAP